MKSRTIQILALAWMMAAAGTARAQETNTSTNAASTNLYTGTDRHSFDIIFKRNIFDPNRSSYRRPTYTRQPRVDYFSLVGTMSYGKARYAFFDGNSSEFRKTLKPADKIAGYKITDIAPDYIVLAAASNKTIQLPVGTRMRKPEGGQWAKTSREEPEESSSRSSSASTTSTSTSTNAPGNNATAAAIMSSGESDAMKRLMLKRLQEK